MGGALGDGDGVDVDDGDGDGVDDGVGDGDGAGGGVGAAVMPVTVADGGADSTARHRPRMRGYNRVPIPLTVLPTKTP